MIDTLSASPPLDEPSRLRATPAASWGAILAGAVVTQWLSAAAGGYIAGRLRQRWLATHTHEVFFRDTAHGLITWAVATLCIAAILAGSMTSLVGAGAHAMGGLAAAAGPGAMAMSPMEGRSEMPAGRGPSRLDMPAGANGAYNLDKLFRGSASGNSYRVPRTKPVQKERGALKCAISLSGPAPRS
jgi:hypothetical protein